MKRQAITVALPGMGAGRCEFETCGHVTVYVCPNCSARLCGRHAMGGGATSRRCCACKAVYSDTVWNATTTIITEEWRARREKLAADVLTRAEQSANPRDPSAWWYAVDAAVEHVTHRPSAPIACHTEPLQSVIRTARDAFVRSTLCDALCASNTDDLKSIANQLDGAALSDLNSLCHQLAREEYADRHATETALLSPSARTAASR